MSEPSIPLFGARRAAHELYKELKDVEAQRDRLADLGKQLVDELKTARDERDFYHQQLEQIGGLSALDLENRSRTLRQQIDQQERELSNTAAQLKQARASLIAVDDIALLEEVGIYRYQHQLADVVAYEEALKRLQDQIKAMNKKEGGAILAATNWTVNGSASEGKRMIRDFSKLMLRAFNSEVDDIVLTLKPYKLKNALDRLKKIADTIEKLGTTMSIRIAPLYYLVRVQELELTADYLEKQAEQKELERVERERLKEERKVQQELEKERARLEKERQHFANALEALRLKGDEEGVARISEQLAEVEQAVQEVDYREANIRAGYVYVISNIGSFGGEMIKVGMTRRLDPMDRIRELSDASVPFNFDVHALFFSADAVGIEAEMHARLSDVRVNLVNFRREFFRATPARVKHLLSDLAGELLEFHEVPEALEYRQCLGGR
jgi:DNA repair exonuclease SbcCD ATPase subunit